MKRADKKAYLTVHYYEQWANTRSTVESLLSSKQSLVCVCGRLATGLHEQGCQRFQRLVDSETIKQLNHLCQN